MATIKSVLCAFIVILIVDSTTADFWDWLPKHPPEHFQELMAHEAKKAQRGRYAFGFACGFCSHLFCPTILMANVVGMPLTPIALYGVNKFIPIYSKLYGQNDQWQEIALWYFIGALSGRLARKLFELAHAKFKATFDKPEAHVDLTVRIPEGQPPFDSIVPEIQLPPDEQTQDELKKASTKTEHITPAADQLPTSSNQQPLASNAVRDGP
jgi:hypothetical protein